MYAKSIIPFVPHIKKVQENAPPLDIFYRSLVCKDLHNAETVLP